MGVDDSSLWEVQWHPASGATPRRIVLTRRSLRRLLYGVGAVALVVVLVLGLMPLGLQGFFTRFTLREARQDNRALTAEGERVREQAHNCAMRVALYLQRARRLAWALGAGRETWGETVPPAPPAGGADLELADWLDGSSKRLVALGEGLAGMTADPRFPLRSLPLAAPIPVPRAVPVGLFGWHSSPFTGKTVANHGVTLAAARGEPVLAPGDGAVVFAGTPRERRANEWTRFGTLIVLDHGNGVQTVYGHLQDVAVRRGQGVSRGQLLGTVGQTGWTRVPAVYYEVRWPLDGAESKPIDPALATLELPIEDIDGRLADPVAGLPADFALLSRLQGGAGQRELKPLQGAL